MYVKTIYHSELVFSFRTVSLSSFSNDNADLDNLSRTTTTTTAEKNNNENNHYYGVRVSITTTGPVFFISIYFCGCCCCCSNRKGINFKKKDVKKGTNENKQTDVCVCVCVCSNTTTKVGSDRRVCYLSAFVHTGVMWCVVRFVEHDCVCVCVCMYVCVCVFLFVLLRYGSRESGIHPLQYAGTVRTLFHGCH